MSVSILHGALDNHVKGLRLGVNSPNNITSGPYMISALGLCGAEPGPAADCQQECTGEEAAGARLEVESVSCTLVTIRNPSQAFLCFPSFLKFVFCLVKVFKGGHGDGQVGGDDGGGGGQN